MSAEDQRWLFDLVKMHQCVISCLQQREAASQVAMGTC